MFRVQLKRLIYVFLLWIAMAIPASADTFPGVYVSFGGGVPGIEVDTGPLSQSSYTYSNSFADANSSATLNATVSLGSSGSYSGGLIDIYSQVTFQNNPAFGSNAVADADLQIGDTITALSSTYAPGTYVPFLFTFNFHYSATSGAGPNDLNYGNSGVYLGNDNGFNEWPCGFGQQIGLCEPSLGLVNWSADNGSGSGGLVTRTFTALIPIATAGGVSTYFIQDLVSRNFALSPGTNTLDASDTAWLNITSEDPNVIFTTGSGLTYSGNPEASTTVPEPSTVLLLGVGLSAVGWVFRRSSEPLGVRVQTNSVIMRSLSTTNVGVNELS